MPEGGVPGRAPRGPLSWQRACSSPEGANLHCERRSPALHSAGPGRRGAPLDPPRAAKRGQVAIAEAGSHSAGCSVIPTRSISRREGPGPPRLESDYWEARVGPPAERKAVERHRFFKPPDGWAPSVAKLVGRGVGEQPPRSAEARLALRAPFTVSCPSSEGSPPPVWLFSQLLGRWWRGLG